MRKMILCVTALFVTLSAMAQVYPDFKNADTLDVRKPGPRSVVIDSTLVGVDIFDSMPSCVVVSQDSSVCRSLREKISSGTVGEVQGYRIRIFFSNAQNARTESSVAEARFGAAFPGCPVYRQFSNPNFKVTVGDFRTRSEALSMLNSVKDMFPAAFIVRETIHCSY